MSNLSGAVDLNYPKAAEEMYRMVQAGQVSDEFLEGADITQSELLHVILFIMAQGGVSGGELMQAVNMYKFGRERVEAIDAKEVNDGRDDTSDQG